MPGALEGSQSARVVDIFHNHPKKDPCIPGRCPVWRQGPPVPEPLLPLAARRYLRVFEVSRWPARQPTRIERRAMDHALAALNHTE
jgi:hypothetical protein